jgi:protein-tyrosine phosphatase
MGERITPELVSMRQLTPYRLYLGTALDARDVRRLYEAEIAAVVDLALEEKPAVLGREMIYCRFPLVDGAGNPAAVLRAAVEMAEWLIEQQVPTLIACGAGMSRSPAVVAMALAKLSGQLPDESLASIVAGHPHDVSPLFWDELMRAMA